MSLRRVRSTLERLGIVAAAASICAVWMAATPSIAAAAPSVTSSYYVGTENPAELTTWGCNAGGSGKSGLIILDFGKPAYRSSDNAYGTINFDGSGKFLPNGTIQTMMDNFATGWYDCSGVNPQVAIAEGVNNCANDATDPNCGSLPACNGSNVCVPNWTTAGQKWASFTNGLQSYMSSLGYSSQEVAASGIDAEPAYNPGYSKSRDFVGGYNGASSILMYDFGAAYGYPWTPAEEYYPAYGAVDDFPVPEVYDSGNAVNWENLAIWGHDNGNHSNPYFMGVMCTPGYLACDTAWSDMLSDLQGNSKTWQATIDYLTSIAFKS